MNEQLPPEGEALGTPKAEYTVRDLHWGLLLIGGLIMVLGGVFILVGGLFSRFYDTSWFWMPFGGLFLAAVGLLAYRTGKRERGFRVLLFPEGLVTCREGKADLFRWEEIQEVREGIVFAEEVSEYTGSVCVIVHAQARRARIDTRMLSNAQGLGQEIHQQVTKRLLPKAVEAYNAGATLSFGRLSLSKEGLKRGKRTLPWTQVESVTARSRMIRVRQVGRWLNWTILHVTSVPNYHLLLALCHLTLDAVSLEGQVDA